MLFSSFLRLQRLLAAAVVLALALLPGCQTTAVNDAVHTLPPSDAVRPVEVIAADYRLGVGDKLSISVLGEEDLTMELRVNDKGNINYPFLGTINASGLTVEELREQVIGGLRPAYMLDPRVTIQVVEYRLFFINGEVKSPGGFPWQPGMTVRKAVALAGGFTPRASRSLLFIIRDTNKDRTPEQVSVDDSVGPGDIITIDQSFF